MALTRGDRLLGAETARRTAISGADSTTWATFIAAHGAALTIEEGRRSILVWGVFQANTDTCVLQVYALDSAAAIEPILVDSVTLNAEDTENTAGDFPSNAELIDVSGLDTYYLRVNSITGTVDLYSASRPRS